MARVTQDEVKAIIETDIADINVYIETAELIVNEQLADKHMSAARLTKIELYLSAHFLTLREKQTSVEKTGDATSTFQGETGIGLNSTYYGQAAITLDTSNTLQRAVATTASGGNGTGSIEFL